MIVFANNFYVKTYCFLRWSARRRFKLSDHLHTSNDLAKDAVFTIQMFGVIEKYTELRTDGIGAASCHIEHAAFVV